MVIIHVQPKDLIKFWLEKGDELLSNYLLLAEDTRDNIQIYLSDDQSTTSLTVWHNDEIEYMEQINLERKSDATQELEDEYERMVHFYFEGGDDEDSLFSDEEKDRLDEIAAAAEDFFSVLMGCSPAEACLSDEDIDDLVFRLEKTLFEDYGVTCWHPTMVDAFTVVSYPFGDSSDLEFDPDEDDMAGKDNGVSER